MGHSSSAGVITSWRSGYNTAIANAPDIAPDGAAIVANAPAIVNKFTVMDNH